MTLIVPRSCTEVVGDQRTLGLPLATLRERAAYVLLGEPGAGKTTEFDQEAKAAGTKLVSARNFVDLGPPDSWQGKPLFIDGLDEMRAGAADGHDHFGAIRRRLQELNRPPFRISCREADWLGASDQDALRRLAPDGNVVVVHLDDLTDEQIEQLLKENHGIDDPHAFIDQARERRLDGLLTNPQTLGMLAEAVRQGWPDSLAETYALACGKLAEEPSKRHRDARRGNAVATHAVLEAAGHVSAVQLLAGIAGFAHDLASADASHPTFEATGLPLSPALKQALTSRLFESGGQEERHEPAHRSIAEFLGARFLAHCIDRAGLPLGRLVALMTAEDGGVVADLRGLHAWLAVHSLAARSGCLARDPLGAVLYGDLRNFSTYDKRRLLTALGQAAKLYPGFRFQNWEASPFGALAGPDMSADFHAVLVSDARDEAHESLLDCVLEAVTHGEPMPELGDALIALARDASHWPRNRHQAIEAYLRANSSESKPLLELLDDIKDGKVEDGDDELTGILLRTLYPIHLAAEQVVSYLHPSKTPNLVGMYQHFWEEELTKRTPIRDMPNLLDQVADNIDRLRKALDEFHFERFADKLLATGLETAGESASVPQLWNWLGIALDEYAESRLDRDYGERITNWLCSRPQTYRALLEHALSQFRDDGNPFELIYRIERRFHGAEMPAEVQEWCFAKAAATANEGLRRQLFNKGAFALVRRLDYTPELLDTFLAIADIHPVLQTNVDEWLKEEWGERRQEAAQRKAQRSDKEQARIAEWVGQFREHQKKNVIEAGTAPPGFMHQLAMIYFGRFREARGDNPIDRLQSFYGNDAGITLAALAGLRGCLSRKDLPSMKEIIDLDTQGRHHYIAEACLAGAEELTREGEEAVLVLDGEVQAKLVAFRLTHNFGNTPAWFLSLVRHRPQIVAEVLVAYGTAMFKARKEHVSGIYPLAHDDTYAEVARQAAIKLLSAYPLRGKKERLSDLGVLLAAAVQYADRQALLELIATKLSRPSLDGAQRSQWLAAGVLLDPAKYEAPLTRHIGNNRSRATQVAGFFESRPTRGRQLPELSEFAAALLIRLLAPHLSPERPTDTGAHIVTAEMNAAELVSALISRLGANPGTEATSTLDTLLANDGLHAWHGLLRHYRESQRVASREAHFQRASAAEVVRTLANAEPSNAADLHALLVQHLRDMAHDDRDDNAMGYLRYWNVDSHGRPTDPRPENECQKRLYELLKERLRPTGVDLQREHQRRENRRDDISASFGGIGGFNVPIEIKRDSHRDLWHALRDQLMGHYVRDPGTEGYGIYLVFWFGGKGMPVAADGGKRPGSAQELEGRLRATLKPDERQFIGIVVMDCSRSSP